MEELKEQKIILGQDKDEIRGQKNSIIDVKYRMTPNPFFVDDTKIANARKLHLKDVYHYAGLERERLKNSE